MSKKTNDVDTDDDFGFTLADSDDSINEQIDDVVQDMLKAHKERDDAVDRLGKVMTEIDKLLTNLEKNPEKEVIKWPNRQEKIKLFREKLKKIAWA